MVHNGIEYGDMQLICEAYHILKDGLGLTYPEMHAVFADWKKTELDSYLIDITADILAYQDETARRSSKKSSTPPAKKARANGQASTHSTTASRSPSSPKPSSPAASPP